MDFGLFKNDDIYVKILNVGFFGIILKFLEMLNMKLIVIWSIINVNNSGLLYFFNCFYFWFFFRCILIDFGLLFFRFEFLWNGWY